MTYIEFFDKIASENVSACLTYVPDRVIYIGDNAKQMKKHIENYREVFEDRGYKIEFLCRSISRSNLNNVITLLTEIVETYEDCVFDITGGDEIFVLALGVVYGKYPDKNIQIHKFNLRNNTIFDCDMDGTTIYKEPPALTVRENIRIYGGDVVYGEDDAEKTCRWDMDEDFRRDIDLIWDICKEDVRHWNLQCNVFATADLVGSVSEDGLITVATCSAVDYHLSLHNAQYKIDYDIIRSLLRNGLLTSFDDDGCTVGIAYKNEQVKKCLTKAGQALEMKIFAAARDLRDNNGKPIYQDAMNGVVIDWDGEFHDDIEEGIYDTENEIDVLLMHDVVPVFISCKNGMVTSDELYKLETVAERFGGPYAKKVLIATALDRPGEAGEYFRQRAKDMNIRLIEDIQFLDDIELARKLKSLWGN